MDALDEDMPTLRKLEALQLYRSNLKQKNVFFLTSPPTFDGIVIFGFLPDFSKYTFFSGTTSGVTYILYIPF